MNPLLALLRSLLPWAQLGQAPDYAADAEAEAAAAAAQQQQQQQPEEQQPDEQQQQQRPGEG